MASVLNCNIPDDLYYLVEKHVWARFEDGIVTIGLTDVAQNLAKGIISVTPKATGRRIGQGKSVATVESSKWVGPVPSPVEGELVEINDAVVGDPALVNRDPYTDGWIARIRPENWDPDAAGLKTGDAGVAAYEAFLTAEGISC
ncbi:MAG TPA: glycine cleavage system protein GcvH [Acidimicrobiia bacterium]|nr:glycine cleavage system protein GcvH [Acidimicrobiia bacterium]